MSSRALRRLRQESQIDDDDDDDNNSLNSSSSSQLSEPRKKQSAFSSLLMMDDSDDSDSDDSATSGDGDDDNNNNDNDDDNSNDNGKEKIKTDLKQEKCNETEEEEKEKEEEGDSEDNFDAILSEFHEADKSQQQQQLETNMTGNHNNKKRNLHDATIPTWNMFVNDVDSRDYDLEYSLRSMLGGGSGVAAGGNNVNVTRVGGNGGGLRRNNIALQKRCLFAQGREEWGKRPSSYIGGGLGMDIVNVDTNTNDGEEDVCSELPWPYSDKEELSKFSALQGIQESSTWYKFQRSNTYAAKLQEFESFIATTGDISTLAMYISDNPFIVEPMIQLAMFFFHTRENEKGMDFVKRILWILECSSMSGFLPSATTSRYSNSSSDGRGGMRNPKFALVDFDAEENAGFFTVLNLFIRNSTMVGCVNTSLAVSRLLLSLDPLRDPIGILTVIDYFALATMKEKDYRFVIELIESNMIRIFHKVTDCSDEENDCYNCDLQLMPNWSYSYALALYKLSFMATTDEEDYELKEKSIEALKLAINRYPVIPKLLLEKNNVNVKGRSFQTDWLSVLSPLGEISDDLEARQAMKGGCHLNQICEAKEKITTIFVERSHKLWSGDDVLKWLFDCCNGVVSSTELITSAEFPTALIRYGVLKLEDFQDSFPHLPVDIALDPRLVDMAMHVRPNARRMLRIPNQRGVANGNEFNLQEIAAARRAAQQTMLGTGRDGMAIIDPDLPIAEVVWRSMLPWARVDGVPPGAPP